MVRDNGGLVFWSASMWCGGREQHALVVRGDQKLLLFSSSHEDKEKERDKGGEVTWSCVWYYSESTFTIIRQKNTRCYFSYVFYQYMVIHPTTITLVCNIFTQGYY